MSDTQERGRARGRKKCRAGRASVFLPALAGAVASVAAVSSLLWWFLLPGAIDSISPRVPGLDAVPPGAKWCWEDWRNCDVE